MRRVCVFTGTRAEYGLLRPLLAALRDDPEVHLQLLVSGMHLAPEFGLTVREIEADGHPVDERVEMLLSSDTATGACKSMGLGLIGLGDALARLQPELLVLLGDRFEALAAATAAALLGIPVAHLHGGETSLGALDESFRHAITKLSQLHFTSTVAYRRRVIQLGEAPERVFHVGALGLAAIDGLERLERGELGRRLGFDLGEPYLMVAFHPATVEGEAAAQCRELLTALDAAPVARLLLTKANADAGGREVNRLLAEYAEARPQRARLFDSLGQLHYLNALRHAEALVGNSSSGILEAPALGLPVVNVGDRQEGRIRPAGVVDCPVERAAITSALGRALAPGFRAGIAAAPNPYRRNATVARIVTALKECEPRTLHKKPFHDLPDPLPSPLQGTDR